MKTTAGAGRRTSLGIAIAVLSCLCILGLIKVRRTHPSQWATLLIAEQGQSESNADRLRRALNGITDSNDQVASGAKLPLMILHTETGATVDLTVIEGEYGEQSIMPEESWRNLGKNLLLINSVDSEQSTEGIDPTALAPHLNHGCGVQGKQPSLNMGEGDLHPCQGDYQAAAGIKWLENLAIVIYEQQGKKPACYNDLAIGKAEQYHTCIVASLTKGLATLFDNVRAKGAHPDGIIFPPLATGHGLLATADFYQHLANRISLELHRSDSSSAGLKRFALPPHIYLQVRAKDSAEKWFDTRMAISNTVLQLLDTWNTARHSPALDGWSAMAGVSGCLAVVLAAVYLFSSSVNWLDLRLLAVLPEWLVIVAWFIAGLGVTRLFDAVGGFVPFEKGNVVEVVLGAVAVLLLLPGVKAAGRAGEVMQARLASSGSLKNVAAGDTR
jgi:hypothetical protein